MRIVVAAGALGMSLCAVALLLGEGLLAIPGLLALTVAAAGAGLARARAAEERRFESGRRVPAAGPRG